MTRRNARRVACDLRGLSNLRSRASHGLAQIARPLGVAALGLALGVWPAFAAITVSVVDAPRTPVKLEQVKLLNTDAAPLVLLYGATNQTAGQIDQFTVTVLVFDKDKRLKARQVAPGRRTLEAKETKFSAMVLDVGTIDPADSLLVGVDQAQAAGSDDWWRADLRTLAEGLMKPAPPSPGR